MNTAAEFLLALFATAGLLSMIWLFFGHILAPEVNLDPPICAVIPAAGDGEFLEQTIHHLLWLQSGKLAQFTIIVVDIGLTETGISQAYALQEREPCLLFCPIQNLAEIIQKETN